MEWLEAGPPPSGRRPRWLIGVGVIVAAALLIVGALTLPTPGAGSSGPTRTPTPTPASTRFPLPKRTMTETPAQPKRWNIDGFLPGTDLDLFARSGDRLYRIQTKGQQVSAIDLPTLQGSGSLTFIADRSQVIIKDWGNPADGFRVVDGRASQPLPDALRNTDQVLPGPPGRLWVTTYDGRGPVTKLTDLDGKPVAAESGTSQYDLDGLQSDGHRGLILNNAGGVYDPRPDGVRRLGRGSLVAVGAAHALIADCDRRLRCSRYLVDRRTGSSRRVGPVPAGDFGSGSISDDGRFAAIWTWSRQTTTNGEAEVRFVDLRTDATLAVLSDINGNSDGESLVWLPDHRLVGVVDQQLVLFDPTTRQVTKPDLKLRDLQQLTLREPTQ